MPVRIEPNSPRCWELGYPLRKFSPVDGFTVGQSFEGVSILGQNGSSKTTGSGRACLRDYMRAGFGGFVLTAKPDEYERIKSYGEETGHRDRVIRFAPEEKWRFNFLAYLQKAPGRGAGQTENIVRTFMTVQETMDRGEKGGGKHDQYFRLALQQLLRNAIDLALLARPEENLSVLTLHKIIASAAHSPEQVDSEAWQKNSLCNRLLNEACARKAQMSPRQQSDYELTADYWFEEFPNLAPETRSSVVSTFTTMADMFLRGVLGELFSTQLTICPEVTHEGGILVIDLPVKTFGPLGLSSQILWKFIWQMAAEKRDVGKNPRPLFLFADEAHLFVNQEDVSFATTARSSRVATTFLSQSLPNYHWALGGGEKSRALTDALMGVLATKIFHANAETTTNRWAADYFAKGWQQRSNSGINRSEQGQGGSTAGFSQTLEHNVLEAEFLRLRKGGLANNLCADAIIGQGGRVWRASGATHLRTTFRQDEP